jgi:two-component system osmolarity sensor histidine kinase EnvZ
MSLFWRNFLLLAALLLLSVLSWFQTLRTLEQEPRAVQSAQALASLVNLTRAALIYTDPIARVALVKTLVDEENVRIAMREPSDTYAPFAEDTLGHRVAQALTERLGPDTIVAQKVNGFEGLWIGFSIEGVDYWLLADPARLQAVGGRTWLVWLASALGLSLLGAVLITRVINQPLQRLADAARHIQQGAYEQARLNERVPTREIATVNRSFNRMAEQLARSEHDRRLMLAGISHDLRTPLARLRLEIEMGVPDPATRERMAEDITQADRIIEQFLDYAREQPTPTEPVVLEAVLQQALAPYTRRPDVVVHAEVPATLTVHMHPTVLQRVLTNLLENAVRHGKGPDGQVHIAIRAERHESRLLLHLRDHGPGVPPQVLPRLSEPFYRAENARTTPGSGLGLAIVRRALERQGGRLHIANAAGGGLEVTLELPQG